MVIIETERLTLTQLTEQDAPFMYDLLTMPSWLKYIGDRGIKHLEDAKQYIVHKIMPSYQEFGFGFYKVTLKSTNESIGICGIVKRPTLEHIDIGFGFLEAFGKQGYAYEAASATMKYAQEDLKLSPIVAITVPYNTNSIRLLEKIGLHFKTTLVEGYDEPLSLYSTQM
jgi:[ribosomal protein S5]-alanine N-acetyltransferase